MCVMILCRKTPSTSSMNMLTRSSEPTASLEPRGPRVRTWREQEEELKYTWLEFFGLTHHSVVEWTVKTHTSHTAETENSSCGFRDASRACAESQTTAAVSALVSPGSVNGRDSTLFSPRMPHAHIHTVTQLDAAQCNHSGSHWSGPGLAAGAATLSSLRQSGWRSRM